MQESYIARGSLSDFSEVSCVPDSDSNPGVFYAEAQNAASKVEFEGISWNLERYARSVDRIYFRD
jgi:hypothetical protein